MEVLQSLLFVPANHIRKVEKALTLNVDAVILDLEDACAIHERESARKDVVKALQRPRKTKS